MNVLRGIVLGSMLLTACSEPRREDTFAFIADCPDGNWEDCRRRHNSLDRASIESFQNMLDKTFDKIWSLTPAEGHGPRELYELQIVRDPLQAFLFESSRLDRGGKEVRVIRTSSETFATITKITIA